MDFTVEPMEDILEREHRAFLEKRAQNRPRRLTSETLARLATPKVTKRTKQQQQQQAAGGDTAERKHITNDADGWGTWDDAIDIASDDEGRPRAKSAERAPQAKDASADPGTAAAAAGASPAAALTATAMAERPPVKKMSGRGLGLDGFYISIVGAGREAAFCLDRKTLFASALEACAFPTGGTLYYRGMPVHNHATASTLGLRQGPDTVTLLLFMTREEQLEEVARKQLQNEQAAAWGNAIASLVTAIQEARRPVRRHYEDADGSSGAFVDVDPVSGTDDSVFQVNTNNMSVARQLLP